MRLGVQGVRVKVNRVPTKDKTLRRGGLPWDHPKGSELPSAVSRGVRASDGPKRTREETRREALVLPSRQRRLIYRSRSSTMDAGDDRGPSGYPHPASRIQELQCWEDHSFGAPTRRLLPVGTLVLTASKLAQDTHPTPLPPDPNRALL